MGTLPSIHHHLHLVLLFGASILLSVNCDGILHHHLIESPKITNWGSFGELESCPVGTFVTGMQLKVEPSEGWKDDTGLNGIRLFCSRLGAAGKDESPTIISSSVGPFGEWKSIFRCEGQGLNPETSAVVGFQLRIEPPKLGINDDTATNDFRVFCKDLKKEEEEVENHQQNLVLVQGDGTGWGDWTDSQLCRDGYAICGIATQIDHGHDDRDGTGYDDTGLNNVRAECCKVRLHDRDFHQERERPAEDDNNGGVLFPDPIESARNLEKTLLHMQNQQQNITNNGESSSTTSTTPPPSNHPTNDVVIHYQEPAEGVDPLVIQNKNDNKYPDELSRLAALNFGHPNDVNTHFKISPVSDDNDDRSIINHKDEMVAANPIVPPPEVVVLQNESEDDLHGNPIHAKINSTTTTMLPPSTPPTLNEHNQLLISSSAGSFHNVGLKPMFSLALFANYILL